MSRYGFDEAGTNEMLSEQYYIARYRRVHLRACMYVRTSAVIAFRQVRILYSACAELGRTGSVQESAVTKGSI